MRVDRRISRDLTINLGLYHTIQTENGYFLAAVGILRAVDEYHRLYPNEQVDLRKDVEAKLMEETRKVAAAINRSSDKRMWDVAKKKMKELKKTLEQHIVKRQRVR